MLESRPTKGVGKSTAGVLPREPETLTWSAEPVPRGLTHDSGATLQPTRAVAVTAVAMATERTRETRRTETSFDRFILFTEATGVVGEGIGVTLDAAQSFGGLFAIADGSGCPRLDVNVVELWLGFALRFRRNDSR